MLNKEKKTKMKKKNINFSLLNTQINQDLIKYSPKLFYLIINILSNNYSGFLLINSHVVDN